MSDTFDNLHFSMTRDAFAVAASAGLYDQPAKGLSIEWSRATPQRWQELLQEYGGPWGWDRRPKYRDPAYIHSRASEPETRLALFRENGREIGYALVGKPMDGFERLFAAAHGGAVAEIENIALSPAQTGEGKGRWFLGGVFRELFKDNEAVCLASRSTNHDGVRRFYRDMGMTLAHVERGLRNDLAPAAVPTARVA